MRLAALLLTVATLAACFSPATVGVRQGFDLRLIVMDWSATRAQVYCDGVRLGSLTGLSVSTVASKRLLFRSSCRNISLVVIGIGGVYGQAEGDCVTARVLYPLRVQWLDSQVSC